MGEVLLNVLYIAEIVIGIGLLIFIHEFGHFIMAKRNGVRVEAFSLGFGPPFWRRKRGDTEYRLSWIPLGGYVKMAGENALEERSGAPDELMSKSGWQRFQIFVAGATMNLLIAFPLCILVFLIGKYAPSSVIGDPGNAELRAGMQRGDRIVEVDGKPIVSLDQYLMEIISRGYGETIKVKVERAGEIVELSVVQAGSREHQCFTQSNVVGEVIPDSAAAKAGIREKDHIIEVEGKKAFASETIQKIVQENIGKPLRFKISRAEGEVRREISMTLTPEEKKVKRTPIDPAVVGVFVKTVVEGFPAQGILKPGDRILSIDGEKISGVRDDEIPNIVRESGGRELEIVISRDNKVETVTIQPRKDDRQIHMIGVQTERSHRFAHVEEMGFYGKAGFKDGDRILTIDGKDASSPSQLFLMDSFEAVVDRNGEKVTVKAEGVDERLGVVGIAFGMDMVYRTWGMGEAFTEGLEHPIYLGALTFKMLYKLFAGQESTKALSGPIGIVQISFRSAELGIGNFIWILALITVSLGIFNLLPIPILDGGHVLLLLFEKVRGKPLSLKFIAGFQYVGLFFILALLVFVCYNDIMRVFFKVF